MIPSIRAIGSSLVALGLTVSLAGCMTTYAMTPDVTLPFAKGEVDATFTKGGNATMLVRVEHLGPAAKLDPEAKVYVVWIKPTNADPDTKPKNVGTLVTDDDYTGHLEFSTPYQAFDVAISPERTPDTKQPSGRELLKATIAGG